MTSHEVKRGCAFDEGRR